MTTLVHHFANLYRDPQTVDESSGDLPLLSPSDLDTALIWALRDGDDELALVIAQEINRLRAKRAAETEAILIGNADGIWQVH